MHSLVGGISGLLLPHNKTSVNTRGGEPDLYSRWHRGVWSSSLHVWQCQYLKTSSFYLLRCPLQYLYSSVNTMILLVLFHAV